MEFNQLALISQLKFFLIKNWTVEVYLAFLCLIFFTWYLKKLNNNQGRLTHWPILGALPSLIWNSNSLSEWMTESFSKLNGTGSVHFNGPVFSNLRYLVTCDPRNFEYILKTNFSNFPKGPEYREVFDVLGNGILAVDFEGWKSQRKMVHSCFTSVEFRKLVSESCGKILAKRLLPLLAHVAKQGVTIDMQAICSRFTFDLSMNTVLGRDDESVLSTLLPLNEFANALDDAQEAVLYRHAMPMFLWKLLRWMNIGSERKLTNSRRIIDLVVEKCINDKIESLNNGVETGDLLATFLKSYYTYESSSVDKKSVRDEMLSIFFAGRDAVASGLVWFLWLVSTTPRVEAKILEDLTRIKNRNDITFNNIYDSSSLVLFDSDDLKTITYLHAALCESLRLFPPIHINSKAVVKEEVLPDGSVVRPGMQIILSFFASGKMPWIWGEDSFEFKPERWIDDEGRLRSENMSKFFAFNVGPRSCLGRDASFVQMKAAAAAILFNFKLDVQEGQTSVSKPSITLFMKNGLLVKVRERALQQL